MPAITNTATHLEIGDVLLFVIAFLPLTHQVLTEGGGSEGGERTCVLTTFGIESKKFHQVLSLPYGGQ